MTTRTAKKLTKQQHIYGVIGAIVGLMASFVGLVTSVPLPPIGLTLSLLAFAPLDRYHLSSGGDPDVSIAGVAVKDGIDDNTILYAAAGWVLSTRLTVFMTPKNQN